MVVWRVAPRARRSRFRGKPVRWAPTTARGRVAFASGLIVIGLILKGFLLMELAGRLLVLGGRCCLDGVTFEQRWIPIV